MRRAMADKGSGAHGEPIADQHDAFQLPEQPARLVGRDDDLRRIRHLLLEPEVRLLTLIGPAGAGKTRLAVAAAASLSGAFHDGELFLDLTRIRESSQVLTTLAEALGVRHSMGAPLLKTVLRHLDSRHLLLVLD